MENRRVALNRLGGLMHFQVVRALVVAAGILFAAGSGVHAATVDLIDVGGAGDDPLAISRGEAAAAQFELAAAQTNVSISADIFCSGCRGSVLLMTGAIGPTSSLANFVTGAFFDTTTPVAPLFSGLSLDAGSYFLVLALEDGAANWTRSSAPTVATEDGTLLWFNYFADTLNVSEPFRSNFNVIFRPSALHFTVTADDRSGPPTPAPVPLPASALFLVSGILILGARRRRRA